MFQAILGPICGNPFLATVLLQPTHICPYGCGRQIPDGYKGCKELLKDFPNYFNIVKK